MAVRAVDAATGPATAGRSSGSGQAGVRVRAPGGRGHGTPKPGAGPSATQVAGVLALDREDPSWVEAGPFRAHLRHLMSVGALDAAEVAVVLGLSTRAVTTLLTGRAGRPTRRISPGTARRLLLVSAGDVRGLRWCLTPAESARHALSRLLSDGWSPGEVALASGFGVADLEGLPGVSRCNRLLAVRLLGLARSLPDVLDDEDLVPVRPAA